MPRSSFCKSGDGGSVRASPPDVHHGPRCRHKARLANVMAAFFLVNRFPYEFGHFLVTRAAGHQSREIMLAYREQAGTNLAVGGHADAAAVSAKRLRDRRDDADLPDAI